MRWVTDFTTPDGLGFEIEKEEVRDKKDKPADFSRYVLRVYEPLGELKEDYLGEDIIEAQMCALRKWGVPLGAWELQL